MGDMMKFFIAGSAGYAGTNFYELVECDSLAEAEDIGEELAQEWCASYGVEITSEDTTQEEIDELEEAGVQWVDSTDFSVVEYNPELHDCYLN
jgi:hypothetical protein